jgi:hypothetical protein
VLLDGLSYRRAGRAVGISKTEVGDSLDLLLGELGALGFCQPDGTFITTLDDLRHWLSEMAAAGEATVVDGLVTRVQRPCGWANQKVLYDAKRHTHTAQGLAVSTIWGDLLWVDGGWPRSRIRPTPGAAPLARAAVPRPGRLPRRRRAHLPLPLAASSPPYDDPPWEAVLIRQVPGERGGVLSSGPPGRTAGFARRDPGSGLCGGCAVGAGPRQRGAEEAGDSLLRVGFVDAA